VTKPRLSARVPTYPPKSPRSFDRLHRSIPSKSQKRVAHSSDLCRGNMGLQKGLLFWYNLTLERVYGNWDKTSIHVYIRGSRWSRGDHLHPKSVCDRPNQERDSTTLQVTMDVPKRCERHSSDDQKGNLKSLFRSLPERFPKGTVDSCAVKRPHWNISGDVGLVSAGRINKDTPPLTTPGRTSRSSTMDISSHIFQIEIHEGLDVRFHTSSDPRPV